jgi:hypothetical protein
MGRILDLRNSRLLALVTGLTLVLSATALASGAPKAGKYHAKGQITFSFTLTQGHCYLPPKNLTNYKARHGKYGKGVCFSATAIKTVHAICPAGITNGGLEADVGAFGGLRLQGGVLHAKAWELATTGPVGYTELDLKVRGSHASGFVRETEDAGTDQTCTSGKLAFTATRG